MKYHIGEFELDTQTRSIRLHGVSDGNLAQSYQSKNIRPKTLNLLLYLAQRSDEVISKQELLAAVWDDVTVDEGVVFQSVREIRKLFDNPHIIQNHPRKGYQFTAKLTELHGGAAAIESSTIKGESRRFDSYQFKMTAMVIGFVFCLLLSIFGAMTLRDFYDVSPNQSADELQQVQFKHRILILPIKHTIPYGEHSWLYLGGMEQLIARLDGLPESGLVFPGDYVVRLMAMAGMDRDFTSDDVHALFSVSGASVVLETEVLGNASDYKIIFRLHTAHDQRQGVVLANDFDAGFAQLAEELATAIDSPLNAANKEPMKEFENALFAQAMLNYERDWETSISFFESYLALKPDSGLATIYLSKLYIWQGRLDEAAKMLQRLPKALVKDPAMAAELHLIEARIAAKKQLWQEAQEKFELAFASLDEHGDWFLKASIAEEQGLAYKAQHRLEPAVATFNHALHYYHITQSPIGLNSTRLHLADVLFQTGRLDEALKSVSIAENNIENHNIDFLNSMLLNYKQQWQKQGFLER
jgi:transcriptional activator of cad operon